MAGISSLGVGSGLDLGTLVQSLVDAERAPTENRLNRKQSTARTQLSALGALKSAASNLLSAVEALKDFETELKAASSDDDTVAVSVGGDGAVPGRYRIQVQTLARAQSLASEPFDDPDAALGAGTLTLTVGAESVDIDLADGANTLSDVRDAINSSDAGVNAVIVRDGEAHRLLLTSEESGLDHQMTLTVSGTLDTRLASAQMTETAAAQDASFSVNGLALSASTNTVDDVISGLTLALNGTTEGEDAIALTVEPDRGAVREKLNAVVTAYNALAGRVTELGRSDLEAASRGPLVGDSTLRSLESQLATAFSSTVDVEPDGAAEGDSVPLTNLLQIGLSRNVSGKASLDADKLEEALETNEAGVEALLSGFAASFGAALESYTETDGLIEARTEGLNGQLKRIESQREALERRMEQVEARLRAQFSALDTMVAQFQRTSEFLSGQLAGLAGMMPG